MSKILISTSSFNIENIEDLSLLESNGYTIINNPYGRRLKEFEIKELLQDNVIGLIAGVEPLTRDILKSAQSLKVIARCGVGMDNVDLNAVKELGIAISNTPNAPTIPVAELTLAHMLNLLRKVSEADRNIRNGLWQPLMGNQIANKVVGIIGYGRIGRRVAKLVRSFGAKVIAYDKTCSNVENNIFMSLEKLLTNADIVTLHLPYNEHTHHIINKERLELMKSTAYLINTSRGGLIDEDALYILIKNKLIAGAGLDAFSHEPYNGSLIELPQVLLTAHMGSYAKEARINQEIESARNLVRHLKESKLLQ